MSKHSIMWGGAVLVGVVMLLVRSDRGESDTLPTAKGLRSAVNPEVDLEAAARKFWYPNARALGNPDGSPHWYIVKLAVAADHKKVCQWYQEQIGGPTSDKELERLAYVSGAFSASLDNSSQAGGKPRPLSVRLFCDRNRRYAHETLVVVTRSSQEEATYVLLVLVQTQSK